MGTLLHPITNWPQYNKSFINRGSFSFWVATVAMGNWFHHGHHRRRCRSQLYTDQAICTFLMLKRIFNLTLRATQALLDSLFELIYILLCAPDYSCESKRARTVTVAYRQPPKGRITDLVIDSTGLKVFGEGKWKAGKYDAEKRRVWRKLHLAVDPANHGIVAAEISLENVHDVEVLPTLLNPLRRKLGVFMRMAPTTAKPAISLSCAKGQQPVSRLTKARGYGKKDTQEMTRCW